MKESKDFLRDYLNAFSPVGQEIEGQKIWVDYMNEQFEEFHTPITKVDSYGTAYSLIKGSYPNLTSGDSDKRKKVVLEAHCDEIAWIVNTIEKEGFIRVKRHGGSDTMIAPSKTVIIHTHDGKKVPAVFGWPAIHMRVSSEDEVPKPHELWLDLGVSSDKEVAKLGVEVGNTVTFDTQFSEIGDYYVGRSLDNKIGGYIIAEVARRLNSSKRKLPYDLYIVNSVQEEVGLFGARLIAQTIQPDIALVHDVLHNTNTPKVDKAKHGDTKGGEGPSVEYSSQNHKDIIKKFREVAKEKEIPLQLSVGSQGNDTVSFFLENIPTAIIATPLKYMHTTTEMVHKKDVESAIQLFLETLYSITPEWIDLVKDQSHKYI
jgi:putative aminopeptidase FrvX